MCNFTLLYIFYCNIKYYLFVRSRLCLKPFIQNPFRTHDFLLKTINNSKTSQRILFYYLLILVELWPFQQNFMVYQRWFYYIIKTHTHQQMSGRCYRSLQSFPVNEYETMWNNMLCNKEHENMNALIVADLFRDNKNQDCHHSCKIYTCAVVMFFSSFCHFFLVRIFKAFF